MKVEIIKTGDGKQPWVWHIMNKGRITANNETFPSKGHAVRAAKGVIKAVLKPYQIVPEFIQETKDGVTVLTWD